MKFQPDFLDGVNTIARHDGASLRVGAQSFNTSVIVPWAGPVLAWTATGFESLSQADFDLLVPLKPEIVIFGSGARLRFPAPGLWRQLIAQRIGFEAMDTAAACRTYNVLVSEGRSVVAALLLP